MTETVYKIDDCNPPCFEGRGVCVSPTNESNAPPENLVCMCHEGFEGERCGRVFVMFTSNDEDEEDTNVAIKVVLPLIFIAMVAIVTFFIVRRFKKAQSQRKFRKRVQTRSTIEGVTVVPERPSSTQLTYDSVSNNNEPITGETKRQQKIIITRMSSFNSLSSDKCPEKQYEYHENSGYKSSSPIDV